MDNFSFIEPMTALRVRDLPAGNWLYELKFDGYRALAFKAGKEAMQPKRISRASPCLVSYSPARGDIFVSLLYQSPIETAVAVE